MEFLKKTFNLSGGSSNIIAWWVEAAVVSMVAILVTVVAIVTVVVVVLMVAVVSRVVTIVMATMAIMMGGDGEHRGDDIHRG